MAAEFGWRVRICVRVVVYVDGGRVFRSAQQWIMCGALRVRHLDACGRERAWPAHCLCLQPNWCLWTIPLAVGWLVVSRTQTRDHRAVPNSYAAQDVDKLQPAPFDDASRYTSFAKREDVITLTASFCYASYSASETSSPWGLASALVLLLLRTGRTRAAAPRVAIARAPSFAHWTLERTKSPAPQGEAGRNIAATRGASRPTSPRRGPPRCGAR